MLSAEVQSSGLKIRVNAIAPGVFPSEMTTGESKDNQKSELPKEHKETLPAQRPGNDRGMFFSPLSYLCQTDNLTHYFPDMAAAVLFVASCVYLNGQNVVVDGGYTIQVGT